MATIKSDPWSDELFDQNYFSDNQFRNEIRFSPKQLKESPRDFFNLFHAGKVEFADNPNPTVKHFIDRMQEIEGFQDILRDTKYDENLSYETTKEFHQQFKDEFVYNDPEMINQLEEKNPTEETAEKLKENEDLHRGKLRRIIDKLKEDNEDLQTLFELAGYGDAKSRPTKEEVEAKKLLAKTMKDNPFIKEIIKMCGRSKMIASSVLKTRCDISPDKIVGVELGDNLNQVLPSEMVKFVDPDLVDEFLVNYANKSLQQNKLDGEQTETEGAVIYCLDQSGSMHGDKNHLGCSAMFGMYLIAKKTNRDFYVIRFDTEIEEKEITSEMELIEIMSKFMGGGTDFEKPFKRACEIIEKNPKYKKADLIFVTDCNGQFSVESEKKLLEMKEKLAFKIMTVMLGYKVGNLKKISDSAFSLFNIHGNKSKKVLENMFNL